jgi:hypothetical protein
MLAVNNADAPFIKGSVLMGIIETDSQGRPVVPTAAIEALKKYLELKPQGAHAADSKAMLDFLGAK